jgi:single-strand DNA-binding protein
MGVNRVILVGRLGKDPEVRVTNQQLQICRFTLATGERRKDASGNWGEHTEWHNVVTFGRTAEICSQYLKKGKEVFIEGSIRTNKWQDKEGKDRYTTEIIANNVQFLGSNAGAGQGPRVEMEIAPEQMSAGQELVASLSSADAMGAAPSPKARPAAAAPSAAANEFEDDDIPF